MGLQAPENSLRNFKLGLFQSTSDFANSLLDDLMWYYQLEELTGTRFDSSDEENALTETGTVGQVNGIIDKAASFPGVNGNYLSKSYEALYDFSAKSFSIDGWINVSDLSANQEIVYVGTGNRAATAMVLDVRFFNTNDKLEFTVSDGTGTAKLTFNAVVLTTGSYFYFCVRYNHLTKLMEIRVNGEAFQSATTGLNAIQNIGTESLVIGSHLSGNVVSCCVDELGAWSRLITNDEADFRYNDGNAARPNLRDFIVNADGTRVMNADGDLVVT